MSDTPTEAFIHLVQDTVCVLRNRAAISPELIDNLERFSRDRLHPIWQRERKAGHDPYVLSFVGLTNVGKSTLMEVLLGFPVAPRKMGPATAIPVEYRYSRNWSMKILYRAAKSESEDIKFPDAESLGVDLRGKVVDVSSDEAANIAWVTVNGPMKILKKGITLADTPGFGAAQIGNDDDTHQSRLEKFITERVDRVYFCVAAGCSLSVSDCERNFYRQISDLCGHLVVTKWEGATVASKKEYEMTYRGVFPGAEFLFVNAKRSMSGTGDGFDLEKLTEIIGNNSSPEKRQALCNSELFSAWKNIVNYMETVYHIKEIPWHKDSRLQFLQACRGHKELDSVINTVSSIAVHPDLK